MSSNAVESQSVDLAPEMPPGPPSARSWTVRLAGALLAPVVAAAAALLAHHLLANRQLTPTNHPYPVLLVALLGSWLVTAAGAGLCPPLRPWAHHYGPLLAGAVGVFCVWELVTAKLAWLPQPYFPGPDKVLGALLDDRAVLLRSTGHSLLRLLGGYTGGVAAGLVSGVLIGWFPAVRYWGMPVLKVLGPIPATALVPVVMMLPVRNHPFVSQAALIAFAVWFPVTMLTSSGVSNVRITHLEVARTLGAGRLFLIFRVALPSALPNIFFGLFMGLGAAFLTLVVAEGIGAEAGLGWYLQWRKGNADFAHVYAALLIMAMFFSTLMTVLFRVRDRVLKWQRGVIKW